MWPQKFILDLGQTPVSSKGDSAPEKIESIAPTGMQIFLSKYVFNATIVLEILGNLVEEFES